MRVTLHRPHVILMKHCHLSYANSIFSICSINQITAPLHTLRQWSALIAIPRLSKPDESYR